MSKIEVGLFWPVSMLEHIHAEATRMDKSLSWCVQKAWLVAGPEIGKLEPEGKHPSAESVYRERFAEGDKQKQTLFFPPDMADEIQAEAARQDRSQSWLLQRAWCLAIDTIAGLPSAPA